MEQGQPAGMVVLEQLPQFLALLLLMLVAVLAGRTTVALLALRLVAGEMAQQVGMVQMQRRTQAVEVVAPAALEPLRAAMVAQGLL